MKLPLVTPVISPLLLIDPILLALDDQVPPFVSELSVIFKPIHTVLFPVIAATVGFLQPISSASASKLA